MTTLGRNFGYRQSPDPKDRGGRFKTGGSAITIGAPVAAGTSEDPADKRRTLSLVTAATAPLKGKHGIMIWDEPWTSKFGSDPVLTTSSDIRQAPANTPVQMVSGVHFCPFFKNTVDHSFQGQRAYVGITIVNLTGLAIDNMLTPSNGGDATGYWAKTTTASEAWLRVTGINTTTGLVETQMLF